MLIAFIVLGTVIAGITIAGVVCFYTLAVPNMKPLTNAEIEVCRRVVEKGRGYPFLCHYAVKAGKCGCQPCPKMKEELFLQSQH